MSLKVKEGMQVGAVFEPSKGILKETEPQTAENQLIKIQNLWRESSAVRQTVISSNNCRLYAIDPELVGKSRWGDSFFPNIFTYISSVFSGWWNSEEVKTLQAANAILGNDHITQKYQTEKEWRTAVVSVFENSHVFPSDVKQITEFFQEVNKFSKTKILWNDMKGDPLRKTREFRLSKNERMEKRQHFRKGCLKELQYRSQSAQGIMKDDPKRMTGIFADDKEWAQLQGAKPPRVKRDIRQINAEWNAHYRS